MRLVFNIKKVGIQTNKPLNWHHGRYTCIDFICLNRRFIPVATKEQFTKMLKCLARLLLKPSALVSEAVNQQATCVAYQRTAVSRAAPKDPDSGSG